MLDGASSNACLFLPRKAGEVSAKRTEGAAAAPHLITVAISEIPFPPPALRATSPVNGGGTRATSKAGA